jgi:tetrahydromethanopterin S-methyltransferase subunit F
VSSIYSSDTFVLKEKNRYIDLINSWIERLETQIELISVLSTSQKANTDLIVRVLNSVKNYDAALHLQISNHVYSEIQKLNSSSAKTQEELNAVNNQLGEIKQFIDSSLSSKLNSLKSELSSLKRYFSEEVEEIEENITLNITLAKGMLKCGAILLAAGIVKEVMIILVALLLWCCLILWLFWVSKIV